MGFIVLVLFIIWLVVAIIKYKEYKQTSEDKRPIEVEPLTRALGWPYYWVMSWIDKNVKF